MANEEASAGEEETDGEGGRNVRTRPPREGEVVRKLPDPKSPSQQEWGTHNLMGAHYIPGLVSRVH